MFGEIVFSSYKVIVLGASRVGKSSLLMKKECPSDELNPESKYGIGNFRIIVEASGKNVELNCWDTAGQETYESISSIYYHKCSAAIIVYDITNKESFIKTEKYVERVKEYCGENCLMMLIGNKIDLEAKRVVNKSCGLHLAMMHRMMFFETSCKDYINIDDAFEKITNNLLSLPSLNPKDTMTSNTIILFDSPKRVKKNKCCGGGSKKKLIED